MDSLTAAAVLDPWFRDTNWPQRHIVPHIDASPRCWHNVFVLFSRMCQFTLNYQFTLNLVLWC